jgi:hypothetical protein
MRPPSNKIAGVAIVLVAVALGVVLMGREDPPAPEIRKAPSRAQIQRELREGKVLAGPPTAPFTLRFTDDWVAVPLDDLPKGELRPVAGLRRTDNSALLSVAVAETEPGGIERLQTTLAATIERRYDDARRVAIRRVSVAAGPALYASFVREKTGQLQTTLVVPDDDRRSFEVDAVIRGERQDTAAQVGAMLGTFDVVDR